jgi:hypothetical protein
MSSYNIVLPRFLTLLWVHLIAAVFNQTMKCDTTKRAPPAVND